MPVFPNKEWAQALIGNLSGNEEFEKALAAFDGDFLFVYEVDEGLDRERYLYVNPSKGTKGIEVAEPESRDEKDAEFVVSGPYSVWKEVVKGDLDAMEAVMKGKLRLKGDMSKLLKHIKVQTIMLDAMTKVDTQFIDDA